MTRLRALRDDILAFLATRPVSGDAADGISRDDLAKRLGYRPSSVWAALQELEATGEVVSARAHVPGAPYRRQVFRLTEQALQHAAANAIPSPRDLPDLSEPFVGRAKELEQLHRVYKNGGVCVVDGIPGVGKTALVRCSLRFVWGSRLIVWMTLRDLSTPGLSARMADAVRGLKQRRKNERPTAALGHLDTPSLGSLVQASPIGVVWVLDELQDAAPETLLTVREALEPFTPGSPHSAVLITQRELPWSLAGEITHLSLKGLSRKDALTLTGALGLPEDRFEELYRGTLGNPRFLRQGVGAPTGGEELFADTVLASISATQRRALLPLTLTWARAPQSWALASGLRTEEIENLVSQSILDRNDSALRVPEPLAQRLRETAGWAELRRSHAFLADRTDGPMRAAEKFVHLIEAEETERAARWLEKERTAITEEEATRVLPATVRLAHLLDRGEVRGVVLATAAELVRRQGDFVAAASLLERALDDLPSPRYPAPLFTCLLVQSALRAGHRMEAEKWARRLTSRRSRPEARPAVELLEGTLLAYRGEYAAALPHFRLSVELSRSRRQKEVQRLALHGIAHAEGELGHPREVLKCYSEGSAIARELGSRYLDLHFELDACKALLAVNELEEAEVRYRSILRESRGIGSRTCAAMALLGIAFLDWKRGNLELSLRHGEEALAQAELAADRSLVGRVLANLAEILRLAGQRARALKVAQRALRLAREGGRDADVVFAREALEAARAPRKRRVTRRESLPPRRAAHVP